MNTHADNIQENKSQTVANNLPKEQSNGESSIQFVDNRPEAIAQRKLQEAINNSPQVKQLRAIQAMADSYASQTAQRKENLEGETLQGKFETIQKKEDEGMLQLAIAFKAPNLHTRAHVMQRRKIVQPSEGKQLASKESMTLQRKVFINDINEEPLNEEAIRKWYINTFGKDIPAKLRNGGLRYLVALSSSVMLNSFSSDSNNFLDLIALTMTEDGNKTDKNIGNEWLASRNEQIEKEANEAGPDTFDSTGMRQLINEERVKVYIDTHQDKHQHPRSTIYGKWKHEPGTQFASGKDLSWHTSNTAETIKSYALNLIENGTLEEGGKKIPKKEPMEDGYIYDAVVIMIEGVAYVTYHCNPVDNEE